MPCKRWASSICQKLLTLVSRCNLYTLCRVKNLGKVFTISRMILTHSSNVFQLFTMLRNLYQPWRKILLKTFSPFPVMSSILPKQILIFNPLPHMPILGSSNSAANKDMTSKTWTNGNTIVRLSRKHSGKRRNCSFWAIFFFFFAQCFQMLCVVDVSKWVSME